METPLDNGVTPPDGSVRARWTRQPRIRRLTARQSACVLTRNNVGRIAYIMNGRAGILPVHYVYDGNAIVGRTSFGPKAMAWVEQDVVFEVDETEGLFDWRSILVRGTLAIRSATATSVELARYWDAVAAIRTIIPEAFTEADPTPERRLVFAIEPEEISGRVASSTRAWS